MSSEVAVHMQHTTTTATGGASQDSPSGTPETQINSHSEDDEGKHSSTSSRLPSSDNDPQSSPPTSGINYAGQISVLATSGTPSTPRYNEVSTSGDADNPHDSTSPNDLHYMSKNHHLHARSSSPTSNNHERDSPPIIPQAMHGNDHDDIAEVDEDVGEEIDVNSDDIEDEDISQRRRGGGVLPSRFPSAGESLERLQEICEKSMPMGNILDHSVEEQIIGGDQHHLDRGTLQQDGTTLYQCHLCTYTCLSREHFNDHMNGHYEFRCTKCEFNTKNEDEYRAHLKDEHQCTPEDMEDEQGVRVPRINSQGKVKTFKCKQCEFVAVTKEDFWKHSRQHIKPEKMLTCPKCSFVTEYKHHLEYHLRNHFGAKPHRCPTCNYSCVNKSMLNSHMKSHTTLYQYRCAECNYATKYCHSLKLHLRKYGHKPDMVLNADGTPNPLPIIDVYGTRRGPKRKPTDTMSLESQISPAKNMDHANNTSPKRQRQRSAGPPVSHHHSPLGIPQSPLSDMQGVGSAMAGMPHSPTGMPLLPPHLLAQMQTMQHLQKTLQQSAAVAAASRIAQPPPLMRNQHSSQEDLSLQSRSNIQSSSAHYEGSGRRHNHMNDIDAELERRRRRDREYSNDHNNERFKCAICDFETGARDIYANHMMLHATKDQNSPPPLLPLPSKHRYPSQSMEHGLEEAERREPVYQDDQMRSSKRREVRNNNNGISGNGSEYDVGSSMVSADTTHSRNRGGVSPPSDYIEYIKKMKDALMKQQQEQSEQKVNSSSSPSGITSTQTNTPSPPFGSAPGNNLFSRLYLESMAKKAASSIVRDGSPSSQPHPSIVESSNNGALDLSGPGEDSHDSPAQSHEAVRPPQPPSSGSTGSSGGVSSSKSRRKGKAYKIERKKHYGEHQTSGLTGDGEHIGDNSSTASGQSSMEQDVDAKSEGGSSGSGLVITKGGENGSNTIMHLDNEDEQNGDRKSIAKISTELNDKESEKKHKNEKLLNGSHICKFCEIAFMDSIMYTIHMGYHGFQDPFKCNMCGSETSDKVSFFMHVATKSHNQ